MATPDDPAPAMAIDCPYCDAPVIGEPRGQVVYYEPREGLPERWTLLRCKRKGHAILVLQEELGGPLTFDDDDPTRVYPPQDRHLSTQIPRELRDAHEEARRCFRAKAYRGAVAMCGTTLEGACKLHGVTEGVLQKLLEQMKDRGLIDGRLWEWADELRDVRNAASHFNDEAISREDADDALAFSEALLDYLYVLAARFEAMKQRRAKP